LVFGERINRVGDVVGSRGALYADATAPLAGTDGQRNATRRQHGLPLAFQLLAVAAVAGGAGETSRLEPSCERFICRGHGMRINCPL